MIWELSLQGSRGCRPQGRKCSAYGVHLLNTSHSQKAGVELTECPVNFISMLL